MHCFPMRAAFSKAVLVAGLALAFAPARLAVSDERSAAHGPLDGTHFVGVFGPADRPGDREDTLYFSDGQFWSANCVPCGFKPGMYWVRHAGGAIHFRGEMESPERGKFYYTGIVRGKHLSAKIKWRKDRWYWSINRDFKFEGTLSEGAATASAASAARRAQSAEPELCRTPD